MGIVVNPNLYTGKPTENAVMPLVMSSLIFDSNAITTHSDVNGELVLLQQSLDYTVQSYTDDFVPDGTLNQNFSNAVLKPVPMSIMVEIPKSQYFGSYMGDTIPGGIGQNNSVIPDFVRKAIFDEMQPSTSADLEQIIMNGSLFEPGRYNVSGGPTGAIPLIAAAAKSVKSRGPQSGRYSATAIDAAGVVTVGSTANLSDNDVITFTSVASATTIDGESIVGKSFSITVLTSTTFKIVEWYTKAEVVITGFGTKAITFVTINNASVFDAFQNALKGLSPRVKYAIDKRASQFVWAISQNVADAYNTRLMINGNNQVNYLNVTPMSDYVMNTYANRVLPVFGYNALVIPGLAPNTICLYPVDSIHVGMDVATKQANFSVIDLSTKDHRNYLSIRADWSVDVKILYPEQFSLISPLVAA